MISLFRQFYYRYLFPDDPTNAWFHHSIKTTICVFIALAISYLHLELSDLLLVLTAFFIMFITDTNQSFIERIKRIIVLWLVAFLTSVVMMLLPQLAWVKLIALLVLAFVGSYMACYGQMAALSGVCITIYALLGFALPLSIKNLPIITINFLVILVILIVINYLLWPARLPKQIRKNFYTSFTMLSRYISMVVENAALGNQLPTEKFKYQQDLLNIKHQQTLLIQAAKLKQVSDQVRQLNEQLNQLVYQAITISTLLDNIVFRAYLNGPLRELQDYEDTYRRFFNNFDNDHVFSIESLNQQQRLFEQTVVRQQTFIKDKVPHIKNEFTQWDQVAYTLNRFNHNMVDYLTALNALERGKS